MIVSDGGQAKVFLIYILFGIGCMLLSDLFYVFRKYLGNTKWQINVLDALYFVAAFFLVLYAGVKFNLGALRYYQLFGLAGGMAIHKLMFSILCRKCLDILFVAAVKCTAFFAKRLWKAAAFILGCLFSVTDFFEAKTLRWCHKAKKRAKKVKIKKQKQQKTVKKRLKMI